MKPKRGMIALLLVLNVILGLGLVSQAASPPAAFAQGRSAGRAGDFVAVTAKAAGQGFDVLFVLDLPARKLHAWFPPAAKPRTLVAVPPRDLTADFDRK